jgi:Domain of unknown function (DUF4167)
MRPGQQNRRPRGRTNNNGGSNNGSNNGNNNNRGRQQNPLARSYESSGPDVKIRGNAQHVAERYAQLARDSLSSGDRVMAENYLQHAEHYNRIIAAAMLQQAQFSEQQRREWDEEAGEGGTEEGDENAPADMAAESGQQANLQDSQPQNGEGGQQNNNLNRERNNFQPRPERQERPERQPRPERSSQDRNNQDRNSQDRNNQERGERPEHQPRAVFVAPIDESQPIIEGTPAEFASAESEGLARTLGLGVARAEPVAPVEAVAVEDAAPKESAPRAPRPRRAPKKVEVADAAEPAAE